MRLLLDKQLRGLARSCRLLLCSEITLLKIRAVKKIEISIVFGKGFRLKLILLRCDVKIFTLYA